MRSALNLRRLRRLAGVATLAAVALLAGCSRSAEDKLAQAEALAARQDSAGALVAVKALLQQKPDLAEARFRLGRLLMAGGLSAAAE